MFAGLECLSYVFHITDHKSQDRSNRDVRSMHDELACHIDVMDTKIAQAPCYSQDVRTSPVCPP